MAIQSPNEMAALLQRFGLERDRMRAALVSAATMTATDLDALEHLEADGALTQRELGDRLSLTSGAITMLVDRLENGGWVRRSVHPTDRRFVLVDLSAQAIDRTPAALVAYHDRIRKIAARVPLEHRESLKSFLRDCAEAASLAFDELRNASQSNATSTTEH